ncbi:MULTISPECIES: hypothetical protein [unclassified Caballeronia]|uniref:hypothetical protein n=1 Tax=unclassified Caballeronia TaxID=2646786 RepID=UPI00202891C2|nr:MULTISPECIES: hypothetical protein [unclassified Caballeronia]
MLTTVALVATGAEPAARSEDKKSACSIAEAALESPSQIRGPSTNLHERDAILATDIKADGLKRSLKTSRFEINSAPNGEEGKKKCEREGACREKLELRVPVRRWCLRNSGEEKAIQGMSPGWPQFLLFLYGLVSQHPYERVWAI